MAGKLKIRQSGRKINLILGLIFTFVCASLAIAQTQMEKPQSIDLTKVANINFEAFEDKRTGIRELAAVNDALEIEFESAADELRDLVYRMENLDKEFTKLQKIIKSSLCFGNPLPAFEAWAEEYRKINVEFKEKQAVAKSRYDKRRAETTAPVYIKIFDALERFRKEKGFAAIVDMRKVGSHFEVGAADMPEITTEFIKYYNENSSNTKSQ